VAQFLATLVHRLELTSHLKLPCKLRNRQVILLIRSPPCNRASFTMRLLYYALGERPNDWASSGACVRARCNAVLGIVTST
jgi:hypothetical protein